MTFWKNKNVYAKVTRNCRWPETVEFTVVVFTGEIVDFTGEIVDFTGEIVDFTGEIVDFTGDVRVVVFNGEIVDFTGEIVLIHLCHIHKWHN